MTKCENWHMQNLFKASYQLVIIVHKETYDTKVLANKNLQLNSYNYLLYHTSVIS